LSCIPKPRCIPIRAEVEANLGKEEDYLGILNFISSGVFGITIVPELSTVAMHDSQ
jgi:hypothetical protein